MRTQGLTVRCIVRAFNCLLNSAHELQLEDIPDDFQWQKAGMLRAPSPATSVHSKKTHFIIKNLWYNNGRFASRNPLLQITTLTILSVQKRL